MDFQQLLSMASNKQKGNEKELAATKKGITTTCSTKDATKKKVDPEKQKKLDAIRARVEAQFKPKSEEKKVKHEEEIMDFTITGLSENDIRRKKLSDAEKARKQREFLEKVKRLKERPVGSEDNKQVKVKGHRLPKDSSNSAEKKTDNSQHKVSSRSNEKVKDETGGGESVQHTKHDKHRHSLNKQHKNSHHKSNKDAEVKIKSEQPKLVKQEWVTLKKEKPVPAVTPIKKKAPPKGPPPMSFRELLSVAQENKNKPDAVLHPATTLPGAEKPERLAKKKLREPDRPMTQEEKERFYRMQTPEYRRWLKYGGPRPTSAPSNAKSKDSRRPKSRETIQSSHSSDDDDDDDDDDGRDVISQPQPENKMAPSGAKLKHSLSSNAQYKTPGKHGETASGRPVRETKDKLPSSQLTSSNNDSTRNAKKGRDLQRQPTGTIKPLRGEMKQKTDLEVQNPWDRICGQIKQQNSRKAKHRRQDVIESDEEYDEDLKDFVVDGDEDDFIDDSEAQDYSKYISEIFGYDKRKFRDDDDDLSDMETGFAEQMKEEIRSAKIGLMEDLEDIKMEEEMKKKSTKKKMRMY